MKALTRTLIISLAVLLSAATAMSQQPTAPTGSYQPKSAADKAHSNAEAAALGYIRTVVNSQKAYKKKHGKYATSLTGLVGSGSFTKRMASPDRGDYRVGFKGTGDGYALVMTPKQFDAEHRSFFADQSGSVRAEDTKPATSSSPVLK